MLDELRLLRSEMEDAKRARQNTALIPEPAALPAPETSAAPPATKEHEAVKEQLEAVKLQAELARLKAEVRDLNQEKQEVRRQVVREMSEDWGALSDVIRSTLLEKNVSSPSAEKALDAAAAVAAAAAAEIRRRRLMRLLVEAAVKTSLFSTGSCFLPSKLPRVKKIPN